MKTAILGVGMIGGSLALSLKKNGMIVSGYGREETIKKAMDLQIINQGSSNLAEAVHGADIVVLATPVGTFHSLLTDLKNCWSDTWVCTDVGSTKLSVFRDAKSVFGKIPDNFIPSHPVAGKEKSGLEAASSDLFVGAKVIVTPHQNQSLRAQKVLNEMWSSIGGIVVNMDAKEHDLLLAHVSHLPHVIAFSLFNLVAQKEDAQDYLDLSAGGFGDLTRTASSHPDMWRDIAIANEPAIIEAIEGFKACLDDIQEAIKDKNKQKLYEIMSTARNARNQWMNNIINSTKKTTEK